MPMIGWIPIESLLLRVDVHFPDQARAGQCVQGIVYSGTGKGGIARQQCGENQEPDGNGGCKDINPPATDDNGNSNQEGETSETPVAFISLYHFLSLFQILK